MAVWKSWVVCGAVVASLVACSDAETTSEDESNLLGDGGATADASQPSSDDASVDVDPGSSYDAGVVTVADAASSSAECDGLSAVIRDFTDAHADFEKYKGSKATKGLVEATLGSDNKPVFKASLGQITSAASFADWYNDKPGVNQAIKIPPLVLVPMATGGFEYDNSSFFPVDGLGFGNYKSTGHNYHFTTEIHTEFTYEGGESFTFRGDDDLWIFVNGQLALDIGGLHPVQTDTINFDAQAEQLGIVKGQTYRMDIFHAERHTVDSNFRVTTNIKCFRDVAIF